MLQRLSLRHACGDDEEDTSKGSGRADRHGELARRLAAIFLPDAEGHRPVYGSPGPFPDRPDLVWFHEYFHGDTGLGLGASHQTGWTGLVSEVLGPARG